MFDIVVSGGMVVDGSGGAKRKADVGIQQGKVTAVADLRGAETKRTIDATGLVVAPGFVDIHSHSDYTLLVDGRAQSQIAQGVTTEVIGNCGHGCAPIADARMATSNIYGYISGIELDWTTQAQYFERLEAARPAVNVATLVPNGNLRMATVGIQDRPADATETKQMIRLLEDGLEQGAFGFSTGLEYPTERSCSVDELTALCKVVARSGGIYATHTRNRDVTAIASIEEGIGVAEAAACRLQISHLIPRRVGANAAWQEALTAVDAAASRGVDVTFDSHTRLHGITNLSTALPPSELERTPDELRARLGNPRVRQELKRYESLITSFGLGGWERVRVFSAPATPELVGKTFAELSGSGDPMDSVFDVLAANADDVHSVMCTCHSYEDSWLRATFRHPRCMPGSDATALCMDGPLAGSTFLGAYTWAGWYFRRIVREAGELSLEDAIHRLTSLPAERIGLRNRGRLEEGFWADVVAFDEAAFAETGTVEDPNRLAVGVREVLVNGEPAMERGEFKTERAGQIIRKGRG
jgi:N-acyl-D-aspartate/D-glutamate deacylase